MNDADGSWWMMLKMILMNDADEWCLSKQELHDRSVCLYNVWPDAELQLGVKWLEFQIAFIFCFQDTKSFLFWIEKIGDFIEVSKMQENWLAEIKSKYIDFCFIFTNQLCHLCLEIELYVRTF